MSQPHLLSRSLRPWRPSDVFRCLSHDWHRVNDEFEVCRCGASRDVPSGSSTVNSESISHIELIHDKVDACCPWPGGSHARPTTAWDTPATATPIADLQRAAENVAHLRDAGVIDAEFRVLVHSHPGYEGGPYTHTRFDSRSVSDSPVADEEFAEDTYYTPAEEKCRRSWPRWIRRLVRCVLPTGLLADVLDDYGLYCDGCWSSVKFDEASQ